MRSRLLERFARILPILLLVISFLGLFVGGFVLGRWDYSIRGLIVAVPSILAALFLISIPMAPIKDDDKRTIGDEHTIVFFNLSSLPLFLFIPLYIFSIIVLIAGVNRLVYFLLISALYFLIFIEVFSDKIGPNRIIFEIVLVMMNIIYGTTFGYPLFFRSTDILLHNILSTVTQLSGHIIPADLDVFYSNFPLFHIFNSVSSSILGLSSQTAHFLIMCPVYVTVIFFLYIIFKEISNNEQISLLACLCFSVSPVILLRGIEMITSVTAFVGYVILLYLIYTMKPESSIKYKALMLLVSVFIILVHQVSIILITVLFAVIMICEYLFAEKRFFSSNLILFIILSFVSYWIFTSQLFLNKVYSDRLNLNYLDFGVATTQIDITSQMELAMIYLQNNLYMGIFIFFALIGIVYTMYRQKPQYFAVIAIFALLTFIFYIPNPLLTSQTMTRIYRIDRFWILLSPFMALLMASGMYWLSRLSRSHKKMVSGLTATVFIVFIVLSLQNPILDITDKKGRLYFTEGELSGFRYVSEKIPYGSDLYSDATTARYYYLSLFSLTKRLNLPYFTARILETMDWSPNEGKYVILRNAKFYDGSIIIQTQTETGTVTKFYYPNKQNIRDVKYFHERNNIIYNNEQVSVVTGNQ